MDDTYENGLSHGREWAKRYCDFGFFSYEAFVKAHKMRMEHDSRARNRKYSLQNDQFQLGVMAGIEENN